MSNENQSSSDNNPQKKTDSTGNEKDLQNEEVKTRYGQINDERTSRYILLLLLVFAAIAFIPIIFPFFVPIVLATTFTTLFYPLYRGFLERTKGKKALSSFLCCLILLAGILVPVYIILNLLVMELLKLYATAGPQIRELIEKGSESQIFQRFSGSSLFLWLQKFQTDWSSIIQDLARKAASFGTMIINRTSTSFIGLFVNLFITLFTMFYFFIDGEFLVNRIRYLSPLKSKYEEMIISRFLLISRATIKGTFVVGFIQGSAGAITLLIFGVKSWLLWGILTIIMAIIPMLGAWIILIPAGIIKLVTGDIWQGIGILLTTIIVVSNIDNIIRPRLIGQSARMHDLLVFFSTLGGLAAFGVAGFIIGPVIASFFITVIDIYETEFKSQLERLKGL